MINAFASFPAQMVLLEQKYSTDNAELETHYFLVFFPLIFLRGELHTMFLFFGSRLDSQGLV